jgi:hypothetical protein
MVHLSPSQTVKRKASQAPASEERAKAANWVKRMVVRMLQENVL